MFRSALVVAFVCCTACGSLSPPGNDAGSGGGFVSTGGGSATGGGIASGGGAATGGGVSTGGGTATGGGSGGGGGTTSPDAGLTWAGISLIGATSTSAILGLSGSSTDVWAVQDTGALFHSSGAAFTKLFAFQYGAKGLYAAGGTVVMVQTRAVRTCTNTTCATDADFATLDLLDSGRNWNLFGEAVCGRSATEIAVVVSESNASTGQLLEWNGTMWTRTSIDVGLTHPNACWYDASGRLYISGQDRVVRLESSASSPWTLSSDFTGYNGGAVVDGTAWLVGPYDYVTRLVGSAWTPVKQGGSNLLFAVGGLRGDEVFALGYYSSANGNGWKWDGTQLRAAGDLLPGFGSGSTVRVITATGPNELYVAGSSGNSTPAIARGRR